MGHSNLKQRINIFNNVKDENNSLKKDKADAERLVAQQKKVIDRLQVASGADKENACLFAKIDHEERLQVSLSPLSPSHTFSWHLCCIRLVVHTATHCNTLQHTATHWHSLMFCGHVCFLYVCAHVCCACLLMCARACVHLILCDVMRVTSHGTTRSSAQLANDVRERFRWRSRKVKRKHDHCANIC